MRRIREEKNPFPKSRIQIPVYRASSRKGDISEWESNLYFFSPKPRSSEFGSHVIKAWINIQRPFTFTESQVQDVVGSMPEDDITYMVQAEQLEKESYYDTDYDILVRAILGERRDLWEYPYFVDALKDSRYDGVIGTDWFGGDQEYVVFDRSQIEVIE